MDERQWYYVKDGQQCGGLIGLIYPILLIVFMRRPDVKEACTR